MRARNTTEIGTRILNTKGDVIAEFSKGEGGGMTAEYEILRADLCGMFMDKTKTLNNVEYRFGDYVTQLSSQSQPQIQPESDTSANTPPTTATFDSGHKEDYDLIVAADGSTSKIRQLMLSPLQLEGSYNFIGQYTAFFSIPRIPSDTPHWYWFNTLNGLALMLRPHRNPETVGVYMCITTSGHGVRDAAVEAALEGGVESQKAMLQEYFKDAGWQAQRILVGMDGCNDFYMSRAAQVKTPIWHRDRTALIGDAAFATFGIGTSLAIKSAYYLAGEIGKNVKSAADVPAALDSYESVFRKVYGKYEDLPWGFPQVAFPRTKWGMGLRDVALKVVSRTKVYKLLPDEDKETEEVAEYEWREGL